MVRLTALAAACCFACAIATGGTLRTTAFVPALHDADPALVAALCQSVLRRVSNATDGTLHVPWSATPARALHAAATEALRSAREGKGTLRIKRRRVGDVAGASGLLCDADEDVWACMFGEPDHTCPDVLPDALERAEHLWHDGTERAMVAVAGAYAHALAPNVYTHAEWVRTLNLTHNTAAGSTQSASVVALFGSRPPSASALDAYQNQLRFVGQQYNITRFLIFTDYAQFLDDVVARSSATVVTYLDDEEESRTDAGAALTLTALWLLQQGSVFIGGMHSYVSRAAYLLMTGRTGRAPPYVSVEGGGVLVHADTIESLLLSL
jgi:hypothetical protein